MTNRPYKNFLVHPYFARKPQIRKLRRKGYVPLGGVNDLHYKRTGNIIWAKEILNLEWLFGIIIVKIREGPSLERHGREW